MSKSKFLRKNDSIEIYGGDQSYTDNQSNQQPNQSGTHSIDLAQYLGTRDYMCPMIGKEIQIIRQLGKGVQGTAFEIKFADEPAKSYVIKKMTQTARLASNVDIKLQELDPVLVSVLNTGIQDADSELLSPYVYKCKIDKAYTYDSNVSNKDVTLPKGVLMCAINNDQGVAQYGEYLINAITGSLKQKGQCIHMSECFEFGLCMEKMGYYKNLVIYNFLELIDGITLKDAINPKFGPPKIVFLRKSPGELLEIRHILVQILFSIQTYQELNISHNDLHSENVMITKPKQGDMWNGKRLDTAKYYSYIFKWRDNSKEVSRKDNSEEVQIYIPVTSDRWIVKIIDWGYACKYPRTPEDSNGVILNQKVIDDVYEVIPNEFVPMYDVLRILDGFRGDDFVDKMLMYMLKIDEDEYEDKIDEFYDEYPDFMRLDEPYRKNVVARLFMDSDLFEDYRKKPTDATDEEIVVLGEISIDMSVDDTSKIEQFQKAVSKGRLEEVKRLVDTYSCTIEDIRSNDNEALRNAASEGHLEVLKYLVTKFNLTVEDVSSLNNWALRMAASEGHLDIIKYLVETFNPHVDKENILEALRMAAAEGYLKTLEYLVERFNLSVDDVRSEDNFALRWPATKGHLEVVKYLFNKFKLTQQDVNVTLKEAASAGHMDIVAYLRSLKLYKK